jgi:hypothetical protein
MAAAALARIKLNQYNKTVAAADSGLPVPGLLFIFPITLLAKFHCKLA